jgi:hypothetical protein
VVWDQQRWKNYYWWFKLLPDAFVSLEHNSAFLLVGVVGSKVANIVYPRKDHLKSYFSNPENKLDT